MAQPRLAGGPAPTRGAPLGAGCALHARSRSGRTGAGRRRGSADGSDDPLGLAALAVLLLLAGRALAPRLRAEPAPGWLAAAVLLTLAGHRGSVCSRRRCSAALLAALALRRGAVRRSLPARHAACCRSPAWRCWRCRWSSSLQFYAGYPLRVLTAEVSRWLLQAAGFDGRSAAARDARSTAGW